MYTIAGPIERWQDIGPQLTALRRPNADDLIAGSRLFIAGLGKKLLLADPMGRLFTALLRQPESAGFLGCWMGVAAFSFQLLFDFSGYSDMARGLGRMCGVRLSMNFDYPYAAESLRDFWRRWHITLSRWFRDYVYIPLGGSRGGHMRTALNLLITWLLTGLWHGAGWNMVIWGLYWGVILLIERCLPPRKKPLVRVLYRILTLILVMAGWVVFACDDLHMLWRVLHQMFAPAAFLGADAAAYILSFLPLTLVCVLLCVPALKRVRLSPALSVPLYALVLILCIASLAGAGYHPFLYFRF